MYKDEKLLQYARESLAEFADFMIENKLSTKCKPPASVGFYVKDARGRLWGKNGDIFYCIPRDESLPSPHPYNHTKCYRNHTKCYRMRHAALVSYELLMNAYRTQ